MEKLKDLHATPEARDAAARELMDLADRMLRGAMSMTKKANDLKAGVAAGKVISAFRFYHTSRMPAADETHRIEAILRGVPLEQCLSEAEKRRQEKEAERQRNYEQFKRHQDEQWDEFIAWKRAQLPSAWAETRKPKNPDVKLQPNGVIQGPWGGAS